MAPRSRAPDYTIAGVSKLTGVSCHTLRVWERRYGFPIPARTATGHRRYSAEQVGQIQQVVSRIHQGVRIADAIREGRGGAAAAVAADRREFADTAASPPAAPRYLRHLADGDLEAAEAAYQAEAHGLSPGEIATRLIEPSLVEIGERWFRGTCDIFQEHCASSFLRRKLLRLFDEAQRANERPAGRIVVATVQGDTHEGGCLIVALLLELAGWRAIHLGTDLPVAELREAVDRWRPDALALSFVLSRNMRKRFEELSAIRSLPIFVGGRSILNHKGLARRHGLIPLAGSASTAVSQMLQALRRRRPGVGSTADVSVSGPDGSQPPTGDVPR